MQKINVFKISSVYKAKGFTTVYAVHNEIFNVYIRILDSGDIDSSFVAGGKEEKDFLSWVNRKKIS